MASERKTSYCNVPDIVSSSNMAVANRETASVLQESQLASPSSIVNINSINCEVQTGDGVRFGKDIFIMTQKRLGEPVLYHATKEFKSYLKSQSAIKSDEPTNKKTWFIVSGNDTQGGSSDSSDSWYVDQTGWAARPRHCPIPDLKRPVKLVIMIHTAGRSCEDFTDCLNKVRDTQVDGFERKLCDIKYGFLVGGDSRVYEGRAYRQRENISDDYFDKAMMIAFIGDYNIDIPSQSQFDHIRVLLDASLNKSLLDADYKITAADLIGVKGAPGENVRKVMSTWERWTEHPEDIKFPI